MSSGVGSGGPGCIRWYFEVCRWKAVVSHIPQFPVKVSGFREPYAPFLKERRIRCVVQCNLQEIRGISRKTSEIWGTPIFVAG